MNNKLNILYFASIRDTLGTSEESIILDEPMNVRQIKDILLTRSGKWQIFAKDNILAAINHEMAKDEAKVKNGDELGFFPPVTGG